MNWLRENAPVSQSPENGSRHCKTILPAYPKARPRAPSQSPENGSRHCKAMRGYDDPFQISILSQSPENGSRHCKCPPSPFERDGDDESPSRSQSPENGSRHCKPGSEQTMGSQNPDCRNPLKTGLGTARIVDDTDIARDPQALSQSPENGSRHCKADNFRCGMLRYWGMSQSPENGSRHCKLESGPLRPMCFHCDTSQSPENGSRHCKDHKRMDSEKCPDLLVSQSPENGSRHCKLGPRGRLADLPIWVAIP